MNKQITDRLKGLAWHAGGMAFVFILNGIMSMLSDGTIAVPTIYVVIAGLIVPQITKYLNTPTQ